MDDQAPLVSVVIPTHNRSRLLREALDSVVAQTLGDWEAIVVDDASEETPSVAEVASAYGPRVRVIRHEAAQGGAAAKNTGVQAARGALLAFLDDDDLLAPTYLEKAADVLEAYPEVQVVFMGVEWFGPTGEGGERNYRRAMAKVLAEADGREAEGGVLLFGEGLLKALLERVPMAFQRPVLRRDAFAVIGPYRADCLLWDCDWAIRAAMTVPVALLPEPLYRQRCERQGFSSRPARALEQMESNIEMKTRLHARVRAESGAGSKRERLFRRALASAWFDAAYTHGNAGRRRAAWMAWWRSQLLSPSLARAKFPLRLLLQGVLGKRKD